MLDPRTDNVAAGIGFPEIRQTEEGQVVALRGAAGEDDFMPAGAHHPSDAIASQVNQVSRPLAEFVRATRVAGFFLKTTHYLRLNARVQRGRGVAVEVNCHRVDTFSGALSQSRSASWAERPRAASVKITG